MATVDLLVTKFVVDGADNLENAFRTLGSRADDVEKRLDSLRNSAANVLTGVSAGAALEFGRAMKKGMDAIEADNLVNVTFGATNMPEITGWSQKLRKELSLNEYALRRDAGTFGSLFKGIGKGGSELTSMSEKVTMLSRDLASFGNTTNEEAVAALRSALVGESEPIRKYNVLLSEAAVNNYAYAHGIARAGSELTEQQKVMARYGVILEQTKDAQGDLMRTKDSPANLARAAMEELGNIETDLGKTQEKLMQTVLKGAHGALPLIEALVKGFSAMPQSMQTLAVGGLISAGPLAKGYLLLSNYRKEVALAAIAKNTLTKATQLDDAAEAAKAITAGREAMAIKNVGMTAAEAATKIGILGRVTSAVPNLAGFGLTGAGALALGGGAAAATAYAGYDMYQSSKDLGLSDEEFAKKRGGRGAWELDRAAMWSEKWDAATGKIVQSEALDRNIALEKQRMMNRRVGLGSINRDTTPKDYTNFGAAGPAGDNPPPPAVLARQRRAAVSRVTVNVETAYSGGDYAADDRNAARLAGA